MGGDISECTRKVKDLLVVGKKKRKERKGKGKERKKKRKEKIRGKKKRERAQYHQSIKNASVAAECSEMTIRATANGSKSSDSRVGSGEVERMADDSVSSRNCGSKSACFVPSVWSSSAIANDALCPSGIVTHCKPGVKFATQTSPINPGLVAISNSF